MAMYFQDPHPGKLDSDGLCPWMQILAGKPSKFRQINMHGPIYDKDNIEIVGGGGGGGGSVLNLNQAKNSGAVTYPYNPSGIFLNNLISTLQIGTNINILPDNSGISVTSSSRQHLRMNLNLTLSSTTQTVAVFYILSNGSESSPPDTLSLGANLPNSSSIDFMVEITSFPCEIKPIILPITPADINVGSCIFSIQEL